MLTVLNLLLFIAPLIILLFGLAAHSSWQKIFGAVGLSILVSLIGIAMRELAHMDCGNDCVSGTDQAVELLNAAILFFDLLIMTTFIKRFSARETKLIRTFLVITSVTLLFLSFSIGGGP